MITTRETCTAKDLADRAHQQAQRRERRQKRATAESCHDPRPNVFRKDSRSLWSGMHSWAATTRRPQISFALFAQLNPVTRLASVSFHGEEDRVSAHDLVGVGDQRDARCRGLEEEAERMGQGGADKWGGGPASKEVYGC